jgi:RNA polymerase sigma-70 factor (ECF subfamily)
MKSLSEPDARSDGCRADALLAAAQQGDSEQLGELLQLYRNYLTILATTQLDARLRRRVSPSDLVQETMLGAHRDFAQFRGATEPELLAWLRQILVNSLHHAYEMHIRAVRRDVRREVFLDDARDAMNRSAVHLARVLADRGPSPSAPLHAEERAVAIANQLAKLRPDYRDVIVLRNLQGLSFQEVAERMSKRPGAVRMLWLRAIEKFRQLYEPVE